MQGWRGAVLVAVVAVVVILSSNFFYFISRWIGNAASPLFILFGMGVAWFLLNRYVMSFVYYCDGSCLRVRRAYGRYQRQVADVKARFPGARTQRAVKPECEIQPLAVAFNDAGKTAIVLLQPEEELREILMKAVKRN